MVDHPRPIGTLECRCGRPALLLQSHTEKNPNRWFFKCADCEFFQFADTVPGYPNMPSAQGTQQHGTPTQQRNLPQQQPYTSPVRLPRYNESPAGPAAYGSPGGATFRPQQQQQGYTQQQAWNPQQQQTPTQQHGGGWQQQQPQQSWANQQQQPPFSPQQPPQTGWQAGPSPQQQQQAHWASPSQYGHGTLGQQLLQQREPGMTQVYGSQGSGSQGGTQGSQGGDYMQQGSQQQQQPAARWQQQQPSSQWQQQQPSQWQQPQPSQPSSHWQQQPQQQQGWQPNSPQAQQPYNPQSSTQWQQQSPIQQQQQWAQHQQYSQHQPPQAYQSPAAGTPNAYQQQQQPFNSPLAPSPMGPLGSGPAAAAASPGRGIVVKVYPAPAEYEKPQNYLVLKTAGFQQNFVTTIKELSPSETHRQFYPPDKVWLVLTRAWEQVKTHLESRGFTIKAEQPGEDGPQVDHHDMSALEASDARLVPLLSPSAAETVVSDNIPPECWDQLMPHQQAGVLAGVRRGGKLLLADEMGLGKTAQSIILACCYPQHWPLLVVCPASLRGVWAAELQAWVTPQLQPEHIMMHNIKSGEALRKLLNAGLPATRNQVLVLTYDLVKQLPPQTAARFGVVICDESHQLKNKDTQRTRAVSSVVRGAAVAVLLTGTPLLSRPIEVWSQVDMLRPGLLGSFDEFGRKYCIPEGQAAAGNSSGGRGFFAGQLCHGCNKARIDELHRLLLANVMVRRTKAQVGLALPTKTRMKVSVTLDPAMQPQLSSIRSAMQLMADRGETETPEAKRLINEYRIATGKAKLPAVVDFIQGLPGLRIDEGGASDHDDEQQQQGVSPQLGMKRSAAAAAAGSSAAAVAQHSGKILIFAYHQEVLNVLQSELCDKLGISYIRIDGATQPEVRSSLVHKFQIEPSVRVALLSIKAAGTGLTLTAADRVVFAELHWNPSDLSQAEDRIHRMGQEQHCTIYYCMAADSADELMWGTIVRKLRIVGAAIDGREGSGGSSSQGLGHLQTWSQQVQGSQVAVGSPAAAAAAGGQNGRSPHGSQGQQPQQRQDQQQQDKGQQGPAANAAAAAANDAGTRRRCLLDQFDAEAAAPTRASLLPCSAAVGHPTQAAAAAGGSGGDGVSEVIDLTGPSPDDAGPAGSNVVDGDHNGTGSAPDHLTGTTLPHEIGPRAAADGGHRLEADREGDGQQMQQGGEGDGDGSQARGDPGTQGSQSTVAVGDQAGEATELTAKRQRQV